MWFYSIEVNLKSIKECLLDGDRDNLQETPWSEEYWQEELRWFKENNSSYIHDTFIRELNALKVMAESNFSESKFVFMLHSNISIKMYYAYAVTLLESFLGDTLKSIISENEVFLKNAISKLRILEKVKFTELIDTDLNIKSVVIKYVSEELFHNIPKVTVMYGQVLASEINIDIANVVSITKLRHDIVHRNGRNIDGSPINICAEDFMKAVKDIEKFANSLQIIINEKLAA
jgi:hypothetical protein